MQQNAADVEAAQANELKPEELKGQKDDSASFEVRNPGEFSGLVGRSGMTAGLT